MPPAIAAVMPDHALVAPRLLDERLAEHLRVLRRRRLGALGAGAGFFVGAALPFTIDAGLGGVPLLHALEAALLGRREALALDGLDVDDHRAGRRSSASPRARAQRLHVVAVDHAHVGEVELLEEQARRPEGLDRLLQLRPEALDRAADAGRQPA